MTWEEVKKCLSKKDPRILAFDSEAAFKRYERSGDIFMPVLKMKQKLPALAKLGLGAAANAKRKTASTRKVAKRA